jgi:hypothetical protein
MASSVIFSMKSFGGALVVIRQFCPNRLVPKPAGLRPHRIPSERDVMMGNRTPSLRAGRPPNSARSTVRQTRSKRPSLSDSHCPRAPSVSWRAPLRKETTPAPRPATGIVFYRRGNWGTAATLNREHCHLFPRTANAAWFACNLNICRNDAEGPLGRWKGKLDKRTKSSIAFGWYGVHGALVASNAMLMIR